MPEAVGIKVGSASCSWPVALKVFDNPFGIRAMRTALTDKDIDVRLPARKLDYCASERAGQSDQEERQYEEFVRDHGPPPLSPSTERVERRHHPHIGQHIHHLLVGQLPSEPMHGGEGCSMGDRDQELPIGF